MNPATAQAAPTPQALPQALPPETPQLPQEVPTKTKPVNEYGRTNFGELLTRLGVPLSAALVGTVAPQTLPGMAGLATGYNTGLQDVEDRRLKEEELGIKKIVAEHG